MNFKRFFHDCSVWSLVLPSPTPKNLVKTIPLPLKLDAAINLRPSHRRKKKCPPSISLLPSRSLSDSSSSRLYSRGNERSVISCDKNERRSTFFLSSGGPAQRHQKRPYKTSPSSSAGGAAALTSRTSVRIVACGWSQPQQDSSRLVGKAIKGGGRLFH